MKKRILSSIGIAAAAVIVAFAASDDTTAEADVAEANQFNDYLSSVETVKEDNIENYYSEDGNAKEYLSDFQEDEIFEAGENILITAQEVEQYTEFYELNGSEDPAQDAVTYAEERNALYAAAISEGYTVTDQEIRDYIDELKTIVKNSMTESEYSGIIQNYDSEDDYWNYEYKVYTIDLPIQKYTAALEQAYREELDDIDDTEFDSAWTERFNEIKQDLVAEQNFVSVE